MMQNILYCQDNKLILEKQKIVNSKRNKESIALKMNF